MGLRFAVLILTLVACQATSTEESATDEGEQLRISGTISSAYRGRFGEGRDDHDLTNVATVDIGDPALDGVTYHAMGHVSADLDGDADKKDDFAFFSLSDTYDHPVTSRLIHAYADVHDSSDLEVLRFGRQLLYDIPETLYLDGALIETAPKGKHGLSYGGYGGAPALAYDGHDEGDLVLGLYATARPSRASTMRLDWMHARDSGLAAGADDVIQVAGTLALDERLRLEAMHSRLVRDARDARLTGRYFDAEGDFAVEATWYELLSTQKDLAVPLDPLFTTLFELFPYREAGLSFSKGIGEDWFLFGGADTRRVTKDSDVGSFNREFDRWFVTGTGSEILPHDVDLSLTGEVWDGNGDRFETWGLDLSHELESGLHIDAGSYYSLFKYQIYLDQEREEVRTWFVGLRHRVSDRWSWRLRYELEDNDLDNFHTLRLGMTWQL